MSCCKRSVASSSEHERPLPKVLLSVLWFASDHRASQRGSRVPAQEVRVGATPGFLPINKLLKLALALFICAFALSACGSRTQQQASTESPGTAAQIGTTEPASALPASPA